MEKSNDVTGLTKDSYACDCSKFVDLMQLILDDEATNEQICFFKEHMDDCRGCLDYYEDEKNLIDQVRAKLERKCCPESLKSTILGKIKGI